MDLVLRCVSRQPAEEVPLSEAAGRVLADSIVASEDLWPFPRAAMDGVAVRAGDLARASDGAPVSLEVVGAIFSGQVWALPLEPGTAVSIATGAPVPAGADAVVPQELLRRSGDRVAIAQPVERGRHVFPAGEEARAGVPVFKRASVGILATGDELVPVGSSLGPGQVRESNTYASAAEVAAAATFGIPSLSRLSAAPAGDRTFYVTVREPRGGTTAMAAPTVNPETIS